MENIDVDKLKSSYLATVRKHRGNRKIIIYGAGVYAKKLLGLMEENALPVIGFAVSNAVGNLHTLRGLPVRDFEMWLEDGVEEYLFLIGMTYPANKAVAFQLGRIANLNKVDAPPFFDLMLDEFFCRPVLEITPVAGCLVNCRFCPQKVFITKYFAVHRSMEMSFREFKVCFDKTPSDLVLDFSGFVEPFLAKDATKMMEYAAAQGRDIRLFTTLVGLTKEKFREIEDIPFRMVVLHLPDKYGYANISVTDEYLELLEMVTAKVKANGDRFIDTANCQAEPDERAAAVMKGRVPVSWSLIDRAGNMENEKLASCVATVGEPYFCRRANKLNHNVLLPNGDVALCCMDFGMRHILGNLLWGGYEEVLTGQEMLKVKDSLSGNGDSLCRHCTSAERTAVLT